LWAFGGADRGGTRPGAAPPAAGRMEREGKGTAGTVKRFGGTVPSWISSIALQVAPGRESTVVNVVDVSVRC